MIKDNPHIGSTFERWLDAKGIRNKTMATAMKSVIVMLMRNDINGRATEKKSKDKAGKLARKW